MRGFLVNVFLSALLIGLLSPSAPAVRGQTAAIEGIVGLRLCMTLGEFLAGPGQGFREVFFLFAEGRPDFTQSGTYRYRATAFPSETRAVFWQDRLARIIWRVETPDKFPWAMAVFNSLAGEVRTMYPAAPQGPFDVQRGVAPETFDPFLLVRDPQGNLLTLAVSTRTIFMTATARGLDAVPGASIAGWQYKGINPVTGLPTQPVLRTKNPSDLTWKGQTVLGGELVATLSVPWGSKDVGRLVAVRPRTSGWATTVQVMPDGEFTVSQPASKPDIANSAIDYDILASDVMAGQVSDDGPNHGCVYAASTVYGPKYTTRYNKVVKDAASTFCQNQGSSPGECVVEATCPEILAAARLHEQTGTPSHLTFLKDCIAKNGLNEALESLADCGPTLADFDSVLDNALIGQTKVVDSCQLGMGHPPTYLGTKCIDFPPYDP